MMIDHVKIKILFESIITNFVNLDFIFILIKLITLFKTNILI